jgi:hypothetical protein
MLSLKTLFVVFLETKVKIEKIPLLASKKHQIFDGKKFTSKTFFEKSGATLPI